MRNSTTDLDLESSCVVSKYEGGSASVLRPKVELSSVYVFVFGVDGSAKTLQYWEELRRFWSAYFATERANLEEYSTLRSSLPRIFGLR